MSSLEREPEAVARRLLELLYEHDNNLPRPEDGYGLDDAAIISDLRGLHSVGVDGNFDLLALAGDLLADLGLMPPP